MTKFKNTTVACVDIGSPLQGNIGWSVQAVADDHDRYGTELDDCIPHLQSALECGAVILGLEAPLFVPIREQLIDATRARKGEERRPWSAGAGAQVLAMNLPIMTYLFRAIHNAVPDVQFCLNPDDGFTGRAGHVLLFEALVSGKDKGASHDEDAQIMVKSCVDLLRRGQMPQCIRGHEDKAQFMNLAASSLLYLGIRDDVACLRQPSPIFKPSMMSAKETWG